MAVPKRKMSRANTRTRRSVWTAKLTQLDNVKVQGQEVAIPRRLVEAYQTGRLTAGERFGLMHFAWPRAGCYMFNGHASPREPNK